MFSYLQISKITCLTHLFFIVSPSKAKKNPRTLAIDFSRSVQFYKEFFTAFQDMTRKTGAQLLNACWDHVVTP